MFKTALHWFQPPIFPHDNDKTRVAAILNTVLWLLLGLVLLSEPVIFFTPTTADRRWFLYLSGFLAPALLGTVLYLLRKGYVAFAAWTFVFFQWLSTIAQVIASGGMNSPALSAFMVSVLLAGFLISNRIAWLFTGLSLAAIFLIMQADAQGLIPPAVLFDTSSGKFRILTSTLLVTAAMLSLIIQSLKSAMLKTRTYAQQLEQERAALEKAMQARTDELAERQRIEARLRGVFENSPDIIIEIDRKGKILFANRHTELFEGRTVYQMVAPDQGYEQQIAAGIAHSFTTGEQISMEVLAQENDGSFAWNSIRVGPVQTGDQVTSLVAIITNIHAKREAAAQIKQRAEQLATIVEIGHAVSTLHDLNNVLEITYQQVMRIAPVDSFLISLHDKEKNQLSFPLTIDEGVRYNEPEIPLRPSSRLAKVIASGQPHRLHRTPEEIAKAEKDGTGMGNVKRKSGSLLFIPLWQAKEVIGVLSIQSYSLNAYSDELVETLVGIGNQVAIAIQNARLFTHVQQELADRQHAEAQVRELNTELERRVAERTAQLEAANHELEAFAYSVSHDLRTPLRAINSFTSIIKNDFAEGLHTTGINFLDKVMAASVQMNALIEDLLAFSRLGRKSLAKQPTDVNALVQSVIESLAPETAHRQIEWVCTELPSVEADPTLLQQVYANLIGNAVKYSSKRAQARIEIGCQPNPHRAPAEANGNIYFVRDNGAGFDMKYADKLFGVFQRLHREDEFEGTGIGLATVQRIITRHGGRIWAEAEPDKGATFYFTLE